MKIRIRLGIGFQSKVLPWVCVKASEEASIKVVTEKLRREHHTESCVPAAAIKTNGMSQVQCHGCSKDLPRFCDHQGKRLSKRP